MTYWAIFDKKRPLFNFCCETILYNVISLSWKFHAVVSAVVMLEFFMLCDVVCQIIDIPLRNIENSQFYVSGPPIQLMFGKDQMSQNVVRV